MPGWQSSGLENFLAALKLPPIKPVSKPNEQIRYSMRGDRVDAASFADRNLRGEAA